MASIQDPFELLNDIPMTTQYYLPKPLDHPTDPNRIIISVDYDEMNSGIFELDLISNTLKQLHRYDTTTLTPQDHTHFIHSQSNTLFIFGGDFEDFGAFNLETKVMEYDDDGTHCLRIHGLISKYIPSRNELHVIGSNTHYIYKFNKNKIQRISSAKVDKLCSSNLLYIPSQNKLITNTMFEYALDQSNEWKRTDKLKFTHDVNVVDFILGFENIMFMFDVTESYKFEIWCHHFLNNESSKSKYKVPEIMKPYDNPHVFVFKDGNHNAHILNFGTGAHVKVDLYKLIPNALLNSHRKYYQPLIMGYLREMENENNIPCIPVVLKTVILKCFAL